MWSPSGKLFRSVNDPSGRVLVFDAEQRPVFESKRHCPVYELYYATLWKNDEELLVLGGSCIEHVDLRARRRSLLVEGRFPHGGPHDGAFSGDGQLLAIGGSGDFLSVFDARSLAAPLHAIRVAARDTVYHVGWRDRLLACSPINSVVEVFDLEGGEPIGPVRPNCKHGRWSRGMDESCHYSMPVFAWGSDANRPAIWHLVKEAAYVHRLALTRIEEDRSMTTLKLFDISEGEGFLDFTVCDKGRCVLGVRDRTRQLAGIDARTGSAAVVPTSRTMVSTHGSGIAFRPGGDCDSGHVCLLPAADAGDPGVRVETVRLPQL